MFFSFIFSRLVLYSTSHTWRQPACLVRGTLVGTPYRRFREIPLRCSIDVMVYVMWHVDLHCTDMRRIIEALVWQ